MFRFPARRIDQFALFLAALLILGAAAAPLWTPPAGASAAQQTDPPEPPPPDPVPPLPPVPPAPDDLDPPQCAFVPETEMIKMDCATLVDIYNKMGGAEWFNTGDGFEPWFATNTPCHATLGWYGVDCGLVDGEMRVTSLSLTGEYPVYGSKLGNNLTGPIPGSIGNLDGLSYFNLSFNTLTGPLPPEIGYLTRLTGVALANCILAGPFPAEIGHLTALTHLDLHAVRFVGPLPNQLGWLEKLTYLHLGGVGYLTGGLPPQLGRLTNLTFLQIYDEPNLGGPDHHVPAELANLTKLTHLGLANLGLTGDFPGWALGLDELQSLYLNGNQFSEPYPADIANSGLTGLGLSPTTGGDSSVPTWIATMETLQVLGLNGFAGPFPAFVVEMNLRSLGMVNNHFTGSVPADLWKNPNLTTLTIVDDTLPLALPAPEDVDLPVLHGLLLGGRNFTGDATVFGQMTALKGLTIQDTAISGDLSWLMSLPLLEWALLNDNGFSNALPTGWAALTSLRVVDVGGNRLSGPLPGDLADAPGLSRFIADNNAFAGRVPDTFTVAEMPDVTVTLGYNALWTDNPVVDTFLKKGDLDWAATQTRPPTNVTVTDEFPNGVTLTWTLPAYVQDMGYYIVEATPRVMPDDPNAFHPDCPVRVTATTELLDGKGENTVQLTGLCPKTTYDYNARTVTLPHEGQPNRLESAAVGGRAAQTQIDALSVVIAAGDTLTITQQIDSLLSAVHNGMNREPGQFTVVLVDEKGDDNTAIYLMAGQELLRVAGLPRFDPEEGVVLDPTLREYDMGNNGVLNADPRAAAEGNQLGAFLRWVIDEYGGNDVPVTVSFIGHGIPLAPPVKGLQCIYDPAGCPERVSLPGTPWVTIALPSKQDVNPGWTDEESKTYITPYTLAAALDMGTRGGLRRITVLDVVHCFAATVEEFYEVAYSPTTGLPMVDVILGSPSYTYFGPGLVMSALLAADLTPEPPAEVDATVVGAAMLAAYETALAEADDFDGDPDTDHPRLLIMVDNRAGELRGVKFFTDELAAALYARLDAPATHAVTRLGIHTAHTAAAHYDTTYCRPQDWQLDAGDGLVDFYELTRHLQTIFGADNAVLNATEGLEYALFAAVVEEETVRVGGQPWFADVTPTPTWTFDTPGDGIDGLGLAIYADFVGTHNPEDDRYYVGMAGYWYTSAPFSSGEEYAPFHNPRPLRFIRPAGGSLLTWADVLRVYWQGPAGAPNSAPFDRVPARACGVELPGVRLRQGWLPVLVGR